MLCEILTQGEASKQLIMHALTHDLAEYEVGDVPSPTKRNLEIGDKLDDYESRFLHSVGYMYDVGLTDDEQRIFKIADYLDGLHFCIREKMLGNNGIDIVFWRFHEYTLKLVRSEWERSVLSEIENAWSKQNDKFVNFSKG
jgi:5'-deoxynucleotidase YfbR-like HD superfamily hydrolase